MTPTLAPVARETAMPLRFLSTVGNGITDNIRQTRHYHPTENHNALGITEIELLVMAGQL